MLNPYYANENVTLHHGDCIDVLRDLDDESIDAVVTDPPYALEFMGRGWDKFTPLEFELWVSQWAAECLRVLKPGGHMLAFGGSRTWHRLAAGIEDAGFEIRDSIAWLYASGMPKSLNVSKAIDSAAGAVRELTRPGVVQRGGLGEDWDTGSSSTRPRYDNPATDAAKQWEGWGTGLKPSFEPVVVARKPLSGTVAANVLEHGTGALNIDGARIATDEKLGGGANRGMTAETRHEGFARPWMRDDEAREAAAARSRENTERAESLGRWPTNVVLDESQAAELDRQSGITKDGMHVGRNRNPDEVANRILGARKKDTSDVGYGGSGGASRFFPTFRYEAKAPTSERPKAGEVAHPTVKPLDLMRWLVRLVTPPGGTVLEPFAGSGTTLEAAVLEGFQCIGIEREADYLPLIEQRLAKPMQQGLFDDLEGIA